MVPIAVSLRPVGLLCAFALALGACAEGGADRAVPDPSGLEGGGPTGEPAPVDDPDPVAETPPPEPGHAEPIAVPEPYEPVEGEVRPNAKRLAARVAEQLTTYEVGDTPDDVVAQVAGGRLAEELRVDAEALLHEDAWSRGRVVYPQLGGMLEDETSVMVVVEQIVGLADGAVHEVVRTLDVRLGLHEGSWVLEELASAGGEPVPRPADLSEEAVDVLEDDRIDLPDTAVWDIHRGSVDEALLTLMARMAEHAPYGVIVLDTGHPFEVFGTDRQSKHTMGQAVDIHRLEPDGPLVVDDRRDGSATHRLVQWLYEQPELSEVGSPWALDGFGGRSFTDPLHQDHLHVGVAER